MKKCALLLAFIITASFAFSGCGEKSQEDPREVILKMQEVMQEKKSEQRKGSIKGDATLKLDIEKQGNLNATGKVDALFDSLDIKDPKAEVKLQISGDGSFGGQSGSLSLDGELKVLSKNLFFKINNVQVDSSENPEIAQQVALFSMLLTKKWFQIPLPDKEGFGKSATEALNEEIVKKIEELTKKTEFFNVLEDLGTTNGQYHYLVDLNKEAVQNYLKEITSITGDPFPEEADQSLNELLTQIDPQGELWIDTKTFELRRIKGELTLEPPVGNKIKASGDINYNGNQVTAVIKVDVSGEEPGTIEVNLDLTTDPKAPVDIQEPADAEEFNPLALMGLGGGMGIPPVDMGTNDIMPPITPPMNFDPSDFDLEGLNLE
ncbi:MAG TPA: hypothetical protein ENI70_01550 [Candidatus Peregrinibacteria bacterium]|nr:hypothetical protein [Candidatus Peregrinibacteria bacterium]